MNDWMVTALWGFFGGFAVNLIELADMRRTPAGKRHPMFRDPLWLLWFIGLPLLGAGLAVAHEWSNSRLSPLVAINIGVTAPLIFKSYLSKLPPGDPSD